MDGKEDKPKKKKKKVKSEKEEESVSDQEEEMDEEEVIHQALYISLFLKNHTTILLTHAFERKVLG